MNGRPQADRRNGDGLCIDDQAMAEHKDPRRRWDDLLAAERRLQAAIPGTVLVGGTAAALHAGHRLSVDGDHILTDLRDRYPEVLDCLEALSGWHTARTQRPVLILGDLDGHPSGIHQLRRAEPLEVEQLAGLVVPTLAEMARIKGWLLVDRGTTRDYLDLVVLLDRLGHGRIGDVLGSFDHIYPRGPRSTLTSIELVDRLAAARPDSSDERELRSYKHVQPPWNDWDYVCQRGRCWAAGIAALTLRPAEAPRPAEGE